MFSIFDERADFQNISKVKPLFVSDIVQKCIFEINEAGTNSTISAGE